MSTHSLRTPDETVVGNWIGAVANSAVATVLDVARSLGDWARVVGRLIAGPKYGTDRAESGADDQYADELHAIGEDLARQHSGEMPLFGWPHADTDAPTGIYSAAEFADAAPRVAKSYVIASAFLAARDRANNLDATFGGMR